MKLGFLVSVNGLGFRDVKWALAELGILLRPYLES